MQFFEGKDAQTVLHFAGCTSEIVTAVAAAMTTPNEDTVNTDAMRAAMPDPHECHTYAAVVMLARFLKRGDITVGEWVARGPDTVTDIAFTHTECVPPQG